MKLKKPKFWDYKKKGFSILFNAAFYTASFVK